MVRKNRRKQTQKKTSNSKLAAARRSFSASVSRLGQGTTGFHLAFTVTEATVAIWPQFVAATAAPQERNVTEYSIASLLAVIDYIDCNHNNILTFI